VAIGLYSGIPLEHTYDLAGAPDLGRHQRSHAPDCARRILGAGVAEAIQSEFIQHQILREFMSDHTSILRAKAANCKTRHIASDDQQPTGGIPGPADSLKQITTHDAELNLTKTFALVVTAATRQSGEILLSEADLRKHFWRRGDIAGAATDHVRGFWLGVLTR